MFDGRKITKIVRNMMLFKNRKSDDELNATEFEMVRYLTKRESLSQNDLVLYLNVDKALVSRMAKKLEKNGYLTISSSPLDSRKKLLKATDKAFLLKQETFDTEYEFYDAVLKVLTPEELAQFNTLVDKVYLESKRLRKTKFEELLHEE